MATLKISDLSVGDWVRYDDRICQIAEIYHLSYTFGSKEISSFPRVTLYYKDDMPTYQESVPFKDIHPIPITAEILEKNGFECIEEDADTALYGTPSCSIFHTKGTLRYRLDTPQASVVCWNVNQLQHALRLAGVDKEINL